MLKTANSSELQRPLELAKHIKGAKGGGGTDEGGEGG